MQDEAFQRAMALLSQGGREQGMAELKKLSDANHPIATLYYAEMLFKDNKQAGLVFLKTKSEQGVVGTSFRYLTLKTFFDNQPMFVDDLYAVHKDAIKGHVESLIVLLNLAGQISMDGFYASKIEGFAPGLIKDLKYQVANTNISESGSDLVLEKIVHHWNNYRLPKPLLTNKKIGLSLFQNVLTPLMCNYFILRLKGLLRPSLVHDPVTGKGIRDSVRTSTIVHVMPDLLDWFSLELELRIEQLTGNKRCYGESMNLLSYEIGQEYKPHYDAIVGSGPHFDKILEDGGQRIKTAICCLQQADEGGATLFPKCHLSINCPQGGLLVFNNLTQDGNVISDSYHAGEPVTAGRKWILTKWIREQVTPYGKLVYSQ